MKRTNLVLNEEYLETATRLLGAKTYSEAVNKALQQSIALFHMRGLADLTGTGIWEGDLAEMRGERPRAKKSKMKKKTRK